MLPLTAKTAVILLASLPLQMSGRAAAVPTFSAGFQAGNINNGSVTEASGIAASRFNPNVLWTHDDSGSSAQVYAMTTAGANLGTFNVSGAGATDWEDIAVGPGPVDDTQYLFIGDIGDNGGSRSNIAVYRVPEPTVSDTQSPATTTLPGAVRMNLVYPDGARDAESLFVDPLTRDIYIISKRDSPNRLYRAVYPQATSGTTTLEFVTLFDDFGSPTAADISPDGNEIIVRNYSVGRLYTRPPGGSIGDAIDSTPFTIPIASELQGEAIGFDPMGWGYYTTTEGSSAPVSYYNRLPPPAGTVYWDNDGVAAGSRLTTGTGLGGAGAWNATVRKWYNGSAEVPWVSGTNAVFWGTAGTITISGTHSVNSLLFKSTGYTLSGGGISLAGPSITVEAGATATINTPISGAVGLVKNSGGTLNLGAANTYTGGTTITAGVLNITNAAGSATGTGTVTVGVGAQLGGTGSIQGNVSNSGTVAPGVSLGTLNIGGTYSQNAGGTLNVELSAANHDRLAVAGFATLGGTLVVTLSGSFTPQLADAFDIITAAGFIGAGFADFTLPPLSDDLAWDIDYGATALSLSVVHSGDFNRDGIVDAADYIAWQKMDGTPEGYHAWLTNFGQTTGGGAAASYVPEPCSVIAIFAAIGGFPCRRRESVAPQRSRQFLRACYNPCHGQGTC